MKKVLLLVLAACSFALIPAQSAREEILATPEKAGGVYYAYPVTESAPTPAPEGFEPFYISHYGRHGSRYLISDRDYSSMLDLFARAKDAGALTPLGLETLEKLERIWPEAQGRGGDLSPLGARQQQAIAARMYDSFPQVFTPDARLTACSTVVLRCALSMAAFTEGLKEKEPRLNIPREASERYMHYLNYHSPESNAYTSENGPWRGEYSAFEREHVNPERLVASLFSDPGYVDTVTDPSKVMWGLYWIAVDMQNMEADEDFLGLFENDELFDLWQIGNYHNYVCDGNYPGNRGLVLGNCKNLLTNIIDTADEYISTGATGATLRFGHDGNLMPLTGLLRLEGCFGEEANPADIYKTFANYRISPMAGNVQIVFFRNPDGEVLVKFLLNERETAIPVPTDNFPFYPWERVKAYYATLPEMQ